MMIDCLCKYYKIIKARFHSLQNNILNMNIPESVFRHEALDTEFLDFLIDKKNKESSIFTYEVSAADEIPEVFYNTNNEDEYNWISNTDESDKSGRHWVCVNVEHQRQDHNHDCVKRKVKIFDSWGVNSEKTCKSIVDNLTDAYHQYLSKHVKDISPDICKCSMTIDFPVKFRIQYASYENCGWFALHFACMNKHNLDVWTNSPLNSYGQITNNYRNMTCFFKSVFFKEIGMNIHFESYKCHVRIMQKKKNIKCNQCCCNFNNNNVNY